MKAPIFIFFVYSYVFGIPDLRIRIVARYLRGEELYREIERRLNT